MLFLKLVIQKLCFILSKIISIVFSVFPIQNNKVFLYSYRGNKYSCNQRGFTEYVLSKGDSELELVWGYRNDLTKNEIPEQIKKVKIGSIKYFYELYTSKYITTNQRISCLDFISKRRKQIYIQTWHASAGLKKVEKEALSDLPKIYVEEAKRDSKMANYFISGSRQMSNSFKKDFWYEGPILEYGTMRNDVFFNLTDEKLNQVKSKYNLPVNKKIILYAPTFRNKTADLSIDFDYEYGMDYKETSDAFKKIIGDNIILLKQHPNLKNIKKEENEFFMDVTDIQDIQELLIVADVLITDYSSVMFDFMLMKKPLFIFAEDYKTYARDFLIELEDLPGFISTRQDELSKHIKNFDYNSYLSELDLFDDKFIGSFEKGKAGEELYKFIVKKI